MCAEKKLMSGAKTQSRSLPPSALRMRGERQSQRTHCDKSHKSSMRSMRSMRGEFIFRKKSGPQAKRAGGSDCVGHN